MNCWLVPPLNRLLAFLLPLLCLSCLIILPTTIQAEDEIGLRPLRTILPAKIASILPPDTHMLIERSAIEAFLVALEGAPPDWPTVYGHGHHDPGHDERLFNLNRERDTAREGNPVLNRRVAFVCLENCRNSIPKPRAMRWRSDQSSMQQIGGWCDSSPRSSQTICA